MYSNTNSNFYQELLLDISSTFSCQNKLLVNISDLGIYFVSSILKLTEITKPKVCYWLSNQLQQIWRYLSFTTDETFPYP